MKAVAEIISARAGHSPYMMPVLCGYHYEVRAGLRTFVSNGSKVIFVWRSADIESEFAFSMRDEIEKEYGGKCGREVYVKSLRLRWYRPRCGTREF